MAPDSWSKIIYKLVRWSFPLVVNMPLEMLPFEVIHCRESNITYFVIFASNTCLKTVKMSSSPVKKPSRKNSSGFKGNSDQQITDCYILASLLSLQEYLTNSFSSIKWISPEMVYMTVDKSASENFPPFFWHRVIIQIMKLF